MAERHSYELTVTTQGPVYPPSEVMDTNGDFVVVGWILERGADGGVTRRWGRAIVSPDSEVPPFGEVAPYTVVRHLPDTLTPADEDIVLATLPTPLPTNNYAMVFAPEQIPDTAPIVRPSYPFHAVPIPDVRKEDGPKITAPITLGEWLKARGAVDITIADDRRSAEFRCEFTGLIPDSLYTVMSLREHDLDPAGPTRPGPLGIPNVFVADEHGNGTYRAVLPNPFPEPGPGVNRIVNVILLWMSHQTNYGGAIGHFGLGGDVHAQLKLPTPGLHELRTTD
ncbi:hypothetical protein [Actinokineospora inagensis]|uniref:hypothetical protein n=1 Tax=Actinokineospora inagensis TaxID=103730 RepID=UPI000429CA37|nr:hypothetical protein [Actinokineospora inagensis]